MPAGRIHTGVVYLLIENNRLFVVTVQTRAFILQNFCIGLSVGHADHKEDFTDEEYSVCLNVRNTHAAINGKPQKDYTKAQMLTGYNTLHTDSAEYKMYGNGIALPCALYCMQGIAEVCQ